MIVANTSTKIQYKIFPKVFQVVTKLDNLMLKTIDRVTKTSYEYWNGKLLGFMKNLRIWGDAETVKVKTKTSVKLSNTTYSSITYIVTMRVYSKCITHQQTHTINLGI